MRTTTSQRVRFLLEHYHLSARALGCALKATGTNTERHGRPRQAAPHLSGLEKPARHYAELITHWLLTGNSESFVTAQADKAASLNKRIIYQSSKKTSIPGASVAYFSSTTSLGFADYERANTNLWRRNDFLHSQPVANECLVRYKFQQSR